jgi:Raf kinase inhibitor-like YbhB/YbcL family protein
MESPNLQLNLSSPEFNHMGYIPSKYTCEGENISPPLLIKNIPEGCKTMVLVVDDPDAPNGTFDHWLVWNIIPEETIAENTVPGIAGSNSKGGFQYTGPCPPEGIHRYFFTLHALDTALDLKHGSPKSELNKAMKEHIISTATLVGLYRKTINE